MRGTARSLGTGAQTLNIVSENDPFRRQKMTGPIAAAMAALISAAAVIGNADCSDIMAEADARAALEQEKEKASQYLIAIDPGHQGHGNFEQEAIGPGASETKNKVAGGTSGVSTGVAEYELTLDIGLQLRDALLEKGYQVLMIRESNDVNISNAERAQMANEANADALIRLHANGSPSSSARGAITMCQTSSNPYNGDYYEKSRELSEKILEAYTDVTGISNMGIQETNSMSGINWCTVPVTILEMGFMTNPEEDELMQDPDFQLKMVEGIASGIDAYLEGKDPSEKRAQESEGNAPSADDEADALPDTATDNASEGGTKEFSSETEPGEAERETMGDDKFDGILTTTVFTPARATAASVKEVRRVVRSSASWVFRENERQRAAELEAKMNALKEDLKKELENRSGKWSLYLEFPAYGKSIGIREKEPLIAASLIKLFVAGAFYTKVENKSLDEDRYGNLPDLMINVSDNGAANTLINAVGMDYVNEFAGKKGFVATQLNRRMLEFNGTENYTSARDCGKMLEQVLQGRYVSKKASGRILQALKDQQRTYKIPAGVPDRVETANKTGELDNVDNDAAIVWSPAGTYILCIMSSDGGGRIPEIVRLSSLIYHALNE